MSKEENVGVESCLSLSRGPCRVVSRHLESSMGDRPGKGSPDIPAFGFVTQHQTPPVVR
jgi:hypothetical protein